jgi:hypothetical protein
LSTGNWQNEPKLDLDDKAVGWALFSPVIAPPALERYEGRIFADRKRRASKTKGG